MKKILAGLVLGTALILTGCSFTENKVIQGVGIPSHVSYIAFNNGGVTTVEAMNADVTTTVQTNENIISLVKDKNRIQFYKYKVTGEIHLLKQDGSIVTTPNGEIEIIDSGATEIHFIR